MTDRAVETILTRMDGIAGAAVEEGMALREALGYFEAAVIGRALAASGGKVTRAARRLGTHRNTLHNRIRTYKAGL